MDPQEEILVQVVMGLLWSIVRSGFVKEYSKGFKLTTNNRMELMAVIEALKKLKTNKPQNNRLYRFKICC